MILNTGEYFTVARGLADPNDASTYYVRAFIRNARTDTLLKTLDLTDRGGQRFSKEYQIPADPSGLGFYISVQTRVYTDSGYTALSDSYGQETGTFLVDNRFRNLGGGGGGSDIDYKKIKALMLEAVGTITFPELDLSPVLKFVSVIPGFRDFALAAMKRIETRAERLENTVVDMPAALERIEAKEFPETDLSPVLTAIENIPQPEPVDLSPVTTAIEAISKMLNTEDFKKILDAFPQLAASAKDMDQQLRDFLFVMAKQGAPQEPGSMINKTPPPPPPPPPKDYGPMARHLIGAGRPATKKT